MPMNIVIREKRKEVGLTQEQIAEYLGVSTPAVNKWEKGATYPDISLLPALARLLKIDLNTLLCFNEGLSEQEIGHFCNEVVDTIVVPLQVALTKENVQDSISILKSMLSALLTPWEMKRSSLYRHIAVKENQENFGIQVLPALLSEIENDPKYAFLQSNAEFQQLIEQYRAK